MTLEERVARFFLENCESYQSRGDGFFCTIEPHSPKTPGTIEHREKRIKVWTEALKESGLLNAL